MKRGRERLKKRKKKKKKKSLTKVIKNDFGYYKFLKKKITCEWLDP